MAVYEWNITADEVLRAIAHPDWQEPTQPDDVAVRGWITRFSARLNAALLGVGVTPSSVTTTSDANLYELCRHQIIARVGAEWKMHSLDDVTEAVQVAVDDWANFLLDVRNRPSHVVASTSHGMNPKTGPERDSLGRVVITNTRGESAYRKALRDEGFG